MQAAIGGNVRYPNLQSIADLFRASINDTANNTTGTGTGTGNQAGLIMSNANPDLQTFLYSAIEEVYSDLRNVGDPELILDNYIVTIPALAQQNPAVQVSLGYQGYFDGFMWHPTPTLAVSISKMLAMWERQTGSNNDFYPMAPAPFGLPSILQGNTMGFWEMRQGQIWMTGCLLETDLRIRARITYPTAPYSSTLNFATAYVPILDSRNAIAAKMRIQYATRFAPEQYQLAIAEEMRMMDKLKLEVIRAMQANENQRAEFGAEAIEDFAIAWSWL
jgi:hypothetical protein